MWYGDFRADITVTSLSYHSALLIAAYPTPVHHCALAHLRHRPETPSILCNLLLKSRYNRFITGLVVFTVVYGSSVTMVAIFTPQLVDFMQVENDDSSNQSTIRADTIEYIRYQCPALLFKHVADFCRVFCILKLYTVTRKIFVAEGNSEIVCCFFRQIIHFSLISFILISLTYTFFQHTVQSVFHNSRQCWNLFFEALGRAKLTKRSAKGAGFLSVLSTSCIFFDFSKTSKNLDSRYHYIVTLALLRASKKTGFNTLTLAKLCETDCTTFLYIPMVVQPEKYKASENRENISKIERTFINLNEPKPTDFFYTWV